MLCEVCQEARGGLSSRGGLDGLPLSLLVIELPQVAQDVGVLVLVLLRVRIAPPTKQNHSFALGRRHVVVVPLRRRRMGGARCPVLPLPGACVPSPDVVVVPRIRSAREDHHVISHPPLLVLDRRNSGRVPVPWAWAPRVGGRGSLGELPQLLPRAQALEIQGPQVSELLAVFLLSLLRYFAPLPAENEHGASYVHGSGSFPSRSDCSAPLKLDEAPDRVSVLVRRHRPHVCRVGRPGQAAEHEQPGGARINDGDRLPPRLGRPKVNVRHDLKVSPRLRQELVLLRRRDELSVLCITRENGEERLGLPRPATRAAHDGCNAALGARGRRAPANLHPFCRNHNHGDDEQEAQNRQQHRCHRVKSRPISRPADAIGLPAKKVTRLPPRHPSKLL
mmetsp:Transcript_8724/g.24902  ORF Transcript_8724/g.24902 Transcript_8724/m.24902 type:complete len:392 (-) Transcript_8724:236-1411(-)